ncbi:hypothetical protein ASE61_15195 [Bosea sp. Root670]|uniref:hypothetical protein n=1 Tax=Bosea sp. Root670 TaxID=1736583 RepID=UPI0007133905|nr:hypothetical protein [Bosea sp. Root670]KRE02621.1 hypothetical protein ASE61_15195 [Bosea sp. Root670]
MSDQTDAIAMAKAADIDPKAFRSALRTAGLSWHMHRARWLVTKDSAEHEDMKRILAALPPRQK